MKAALFDEGVQGAILLCPRCGWSTLHHGVVHVLQRAREDDNGIRLTVPGGGFVVDPVQLTWESKLSCAPADHSSFHGRRGEVQVEFRCEHCDGDGGGKPLRLLLVQHKGQTLFLWDGDL